MYPTPSVICTAYLWIQSRRRKSLTFAGSVAAVGTAIVHAAHPTWAAFGMLVAFYLMGSKATKYKHHIKSEKTTTIPSQGGSTLPPRPASNPRSDRPVADRTSTTTTAPAPAPRTHVQVFANSLLASILLLVHTFILTSTRSSNRTTDVGHTPFSQSYCLPISRTVFHQSTSASTSPPMTLSDLLFVGVIASYAAVTADTLSSELGILSTSPPRLITRPWKPVAPGTNGGVTVAGLVSGFVGAGIIGLIAAVGASCPAGPDIVTTTNTTTTIFTSSFLSPDSQLIQKSLFVLAIATLGTVGSVLDSLLGALFQETRVGDDGKVLEVEGGGKLSSTSSHLSRQTGLNDNTSDGVSPPPAALPKDGGSKVVAGMDVLSNNGVNALMALLTTITGMIVFGVAYGVTLSS